MVLILNGVAGSEVVLILFFVLIFFGAKSIPGLAKTLGRTMRQVKDASADIQNEIKKSSAEMKKDLNLEGLIRDTAEDIKRPLDQYAQDIDNAVKYQPRKPNSHIPVPTIEDDVDVSADAEVVDEQIKVKPEENQAPPMDEKTEQESNKAT